MITKLLEGAPVKAPSLPNTDVMKPKVLLVDDQPARLLTYEALLEGLGVCCTRAESGTAALERLLSQEFAVIVLDVNMPGMDGFEVARHVREHPRFEQTPIIFVTGVNITELDRLRGYEVGGIDYIQLPIVPEIFRSKVALLVELYLRRSDLKTLNRKLEAARSQLERERNDAISKAQELQSRSEGSKPQDPVALAARAEANLDRAWLKALLEGMADEVYFTDAKGKYVYANPAVDREFGHISIEGNDVVSVVAKLEVFRADGSLRPIEEAPPLRALNGEVVREEEQLVRIPRDGEMRHRLVSAAPVRDANGAIIGSVAVVRDVTERRRTEKERARSAARSAALLRLNDMFRALSEPADLAYAAAQILGETLGVSRCGYGTIDRVAETITIERDWNAPGIHSLAGVLHFRDYGTYIDELKRGETVVCVDAVSDERTMTSASALASIQVQSFVNMPITEQEGTVALLYLNHVSARSWHDDELALIRDIAERTRVAVERRRSEQAVAADLECMGMLRDLSAKVVAEDRPGTLFEDILATAMFITRADGGTIQLWDEQLGELTLAAARGLEEKLLASFRRVRPGSGSSCGLALAAKQRVFIGFEAGDGEDPDGSRWLLRSFGLRCAQSTPLVTRAGRMLGMFSTHWRRKLSLGERDLRFLDLLARQAADLIERQEVERAMREADRRKDEFIAMLSHELRNPLVPIRNGIGLLKKAPDPEGILAKIQPMMERQITHTVRLIDDLLDVSRISSGRLELVRSSVTLESIVSAAVEAHRERILGKDVELHVHVDAPDRILFVDATRVVQVISNLLSNAVKFSAPAGRIDFAARIEDSDNAGAQHVRISVRDSGVGISADALPRIFDLFFVSTKGSGDRSRGSGLGVGLALARRIVEMHGGSLDAHSEGVGGGAEFVMRLPLGAPTPELTQASTPTSVSKIAGPVLVVDDNRDGADSLVLLLKAMGAEADAVYDGQSALAFAQKRRPPIVILDIGMPEMDGYDVCRRLRRLLGSAVRIIALTGWGQQSDKQKANDAGFDAHLTKPVDAESLTEALTEKGL